MYRRALRLCQRVLLSVKQLGSNLGVSLQVKILCVLCRFSSAFPKEITRFWSSAIFPLWIWNPSSRLVLNYLIKL